MRNLVSPELHNPDTRSAVAQEPARGVGLLGDQLVNWGGGCDLLRLIAAGLTSPHLRVSLLLPRRTVTSRVRGELGAWKRMAANLIRMERPRYTKAQSMAADKVIATVRSSGCMIDPILYAPTRSGLGRTISAQNISVVLPCFQSLGREFPHPWVGYIADLQHKSLPQFFSSRERENRDHAFQAMLNDARCIVVASNSVKDDLLRYCDTSACDIFVLPFTPLPQPEWLVGDAQEVRSKYSLPERYFLISNQFWQHKDHATAFEALASLSAVDVQLICTGSTHDYRAPEHFASLERLVGKLGIRDRVRFLGHIPKSEQIAIMRAAVAVVQPTLFEGGPGGGSVYDAVGIGTPAIVSDIAVNREITDEAVEFFRVRSAADLAEKMQQALETPAARPGAETLLARADVRRERLANVLMQAVESVMKAELAEAR